MFFSTNIIEPTRIDTILSSEEAQLSEILDEDDVIQQCVGQNMKLIDFLCQDTTFNKLLGYILSKPDPELDVTEQYKYPSRACEVLTCEIPELTNKLAESEDYLVRIFSVIDLRDNSVTPLQASFCVKLIQHLFKMKPKYLYDFIEKRAEQTCEIISSCLHLPCLLDLLLQFSTPVEDLDSGLPASDCFLNPLVDVGLSNVFISAIHPSEINENSRDAATNAAQFCCELFRSTPSCNLATALSNEKSVETLFSLLFPEDKSSVPEFVLYHGFSFMNTILSIDRQDMTSDRRDSTTATLTLDDLDNIDAVDLNDDDCIESNNKTGGTSDTQPQHVPLSSTRVADTSSKQLKKPLPAYIKRIVNSLLNNLCHISALLDSPPPQFPNSRLCLSSTVNKENAVDIPPFGRLRLSLTHMILLLLELHNDKVDQALADSGLLKTVLQLFLQYHWNSLLHTAVERIIGTVLSTSGDDKPMIINLLRDCKFVEMLLQTFDENDKLGNACPGSSGHILIMANSFVSALETNEAELAKHVPSDVMENWRKFASETLAKINEQNKPDRLSLGNSSYGNGSTSQIMMMMASGVISSSLSANGQRLRLGGRHPRTGVSAIDDDEDEDLDEIDRHGEENFSIDSVLRQMQCEYQRQDLSAKPLASFNSAIADLELDPQTSVLGNLDLPLPPLAVGPPDQRKNATSEIQDINDNEQAFQAKCEERISFPSDAIVQRETLNSSSDEDDNLWQDDEVQQGSFASAHHSTTKHIFEDAQGNVREVKESEWHPFTSSTPEDVDPFLGGTPKTSDNNSSDEGDNNSSHSSSDVEEVQPFSEDKASASSFADFSSISGGGADWPGEAVTKDDSSTGDWPGSDSVQTFEAKFEASFETFSSNAADAWSQSEPSTTTTVVVESAVVEEATEEAENPPVPSRIPPAIPPRVGRSSSPSPPNNSS